MTYTRESSQEFETVSASFSFLLISRVLRMPRVFSRIHLHLDREINAQL